jgi:RHS repeat-associated protein
MAQANPFRFSTKYQDDETDLLYYGYRYYSASAGSWLSRDPAQELSFWLMSRIARIRGSLFTTEREYGFCFNNPINEVDLFGLDSWWTTFLEWLKTTAYYFCPGNEPAAAAECAPDFAKIALITAYKNAYVRLEESGAPPQQVAAAWKRYEDAQNGVYNTAAQCLKTNCPCKTNTTPPYKKK